MRIPFSPPPGLNSDDTTFAAEGRYADGSNVRFWRGKPQVIRGSLIIVNTAMSSTPRRIAYHTGSGGTTYGHIGCDNHLYHYNGAGSLTAVTPAGFASSGGSEWSLQQFGDKLLAANHGGNNSDKKLYEKNLSGTSAATLVAAAPTGIRAMLVTAERQCLVFGCTEEGSGTFNPACIRGSDLEDYSDWTTTSSNNAFEHILDGGGVIQDAKIIGPYVAVWTNRSLWLGQFIGDPGQTYRFDKVADIGVYSLGQGKSVVLRGATAYWLSPERVFYQWTPGTLPVPIPCPISKAFRDEFGPHTNRIHGAQIGRFNEVWWFHSSVSDFVSYGNECSRYVAFNIEDGTWFRGLMRRTAMWDGDDLGRIVTTNLDDKKLLEHEASSPDISFDWHIQSADQYLDEGETESMIRGIFPDFEDQVGDVSLTVYVRQRPQSSATTKGPYTLSTSTTKKDFRASGKVVAVKVSGTGATSYMRLGKPSFDVVSTGKRA